MLKKGYVKTIQDAFDRFIGEKKCCFDPGPSFGVQETIDQVHQAQGKVFIAHPNSIGHNKTLYEILDMNVDGIECYYSILHCKREARFLQLAKNRNLLISGGSDFHGEIKPHIALGCSYVDKSTVEKIFGPL